MEDELYDAYQQNQSNIDDERVQRELDRYRNMPMEDLMRGLDQEMYGAAVPEAEKKTTTSQFVQTSKAIARDFGKGLTETPLQVAGAAMDASREMLEFVREAENWIADEAGYYPVLNLEDPGRRGLIRNLADLDADERAGIEEVIPKIRAPESGTGAFVRGSAQFIIPFVGVQKTFKGVKLFRESGRITQAVISGVVVDFTAFDPFEDRLADLMKDIPTGQAQPFFEWLATEDSALEGRAKNAIEGIFLGVAVDSVMALGKAVIHMRRARSAANRAANEQAAERQTEGYTATRRIEEEEADLAQKLSSLVGEDPETAIEKAREFIREYDEMRPDLPEQRGLTPEEQDFENRVQARAKEILAEKGLDPETVYEAGNVESGDALLQARNELLPEPDLIDPPTRPISPEEPTAAPTAEATAPEAAPAPAAASPAQELLDNFLDSNAFNPLLDRIVESATAKQLKGIYRQLFGSAPKGRTKQQVADEIDRRRRREVDVLDRDDEGRAELAARTLFDDPDAPKGPLGPAADEVLEDIRATEAGEQPTGPGAERVERAAGVEPEAEAQPQPKPEDDIEEQIRGLVGEKLEEVPEDTERLAADILRPRTPAEKLVDQIENMPAMEARARASEITGETYRSKSDAIEGVRKYVDIEQKPYINMRAITSEEDLETILRNIADMYKDSYIPEKTTWAKTREEAAAIDSLETLLIMNPERLTAAEVYALQDLYKASSIQLRNLSKEAANSTDPVVQFAFRRQVALHAIIGARAVGAASAKGRGLNILQAAKEGTDPRGVLEAIKNSIDETGGVEVSRALAREVHDAFLSGDPKAVDNMIKRSWWGKTKDMIDEAGVVAKLLNLTTQAVNIAGNALVLPWEAMNRKVAHGISYVSGSQMGVQEGEAFMMLRGNLMGLRSAFVEAYRTIRTGERYLGHSKIEVPQQSAFHPDVVGVQGDTAPGALLRIALKASTIPSTIVFRGLNGADTFFKVLNQKAELYAQAQRKAVLEAGDDPSKLGELFQNYLENPSREMMETAKKSALDNTFTSPSGEGVKLLMQLRSKIPILGYQILPFIQTPANIIGYALRSSPLAPLSGEFPRQIKAGGAERDKAIARVATGTTMMALGIDMALNGEITGSGPPIGSPMRSAWEKKYQPFSYVLPNGRTEQYNRFDPFGVWLGISAEIVDMFIYQNADPNHVKEFDEIFASLAFSLGGVMMNKTWMTGASDLIQALSDPERYSEQFVKNTLTGYIPGIVKTGARIDDPVLRQTTNIWESFQSVLPVVKRRLPSNTDYLGRESMQGSEFDDPTVRGLWNLLVPIQSKPDRAEPIDNELIRLQTGFREPSPLISYDPKDGREGVIVSIRNEGEIISRYNYLTGQGRYGNSTFPYTNMSLNEVLNELVSGQTADGKRLIGRRAEYHRIYQEASDGPNGGKKDLIDRFVSRYRAAARRQLFQEYPEFFNSEREIRLRRREYIAEKQAEKPEAQAGEMPTIR